LAEGGGGPAGGLGTTLGLDRGIANCNPCSLWRASRCCASTFSLVEDDPLTALRDLELALLLLHGMLDELHGVPGFAQHLLHLKAAATLWH